MTDLSIDMAHLMREDFDVEAPDREMFREEEDVNGPRTTHLYRRKVLLLVPHSCHFQVLSNQAKKGSEFVDTPFVLDYFTQKWMKSQDAWQRSELIKFCNFVLDDFQKVTLQTYSYTRTIRYINDTKFTDRDLNAVVKTLRCLGEIKLAEKANSLIQKPATSSPAYTTGN